MPRPCIGQVAIVAKRRLADEYDAAQARGEAAGKGGHYRDNVARADIVTQKDAGITRQEMHEDTKSATPKPATPAW